MNKRIRMGVIGAAALALATGAGPFAFAKGGPSGNMNLRLNGSEIISAAQVNTLLIGQVIAGTHGDFEGSATFTAANASETDVCAASISSGQITAPTGGFGSATGLFTIDLSLTGVSTVSGTGNFCTANSNSALTLTCTRTLVHKNLVNDLNAGQYHCVVTAITGVTGASMEGHLDIVSGSNSPQS
jgi:hypothetical protein